jgi:hypothetical protein
MAAWWLCNARDGWRRHFYSQASSWEEGNLRTKARVGSTWRGIGNRTATTCGCDCPMAGGGAAVQPVA